MHRPGDRRPIAARGWWPIRAAAGWLIRRGASANAISVWGMVAGLAAGAAFAAVPLAAGAGRALWLGGAVLIQVRLLANVLDGMVAVGRGVASPLGELFNEVPDRVSDSAVLAGLGWAVGAPGLGLAAALAAMATAYVRTVGRAAGAPSDFRGPMAKQQRMAMATGMAVVCAAAPGWSAWVGRGGLWCIVVLALLTSGRRLVGIAGALRA